MTADLFKHGNQEAYDLTNGLMSCSYPSNASEICSNASSGWLIWRIVMIWTEAVRNGVITRMINADLIVETRDWEGRRLHDICIYRHCRWAWEKIQNKRGTKCTRLCVFVKKEREGEGEERQRKKREGGRGREKKERERKCIPWRVQEAQQRGSLWMLRFALHGTDPLAED